MAFLGKVEQEQKKKNNAHAEGPVHQSCEIIIKSVLS